MKNAVMDILQLEDSYLKENVGSVIATGTQLPATKSHFNVMYENIIVPREFETARTRPH